MSADSSRTSNIQVAVITVIAAVHAAVMLPSLATGKASERHGSASTVALSQQLNQPETAARTLQASAGFETGSRHQAHQARAEIAR